MPTYRVWANSDTEGIIDHVLDADDEAHAREVFASFHPDGGIELVEDHEAHGKREEERRASEAAQAQLILPKPRRKKLVKAVPVDTATSSHVTFTVPKDERG